MWDPGFCAFWAGFAYFSRGFLLMSREIPIDFYLLVWKGRGFSF